MKKYLFVLILILATVGQVAWAPFILVQGVVFPVIIVFLWVMLPQIDLQYILLAGFSSGLFVDLLGTDKAGTHALAILIATGIMQIVEKYTVKNTVIYRFASFVIGLICYIYIYQFLSEF